MPIEIKELNIRTFVNDNSQSDAKGMQGGGKLPPDEKACIISACVEQVMQLLKDKEER